MKVKYKFSVGTHYVRSTVNEEVEVDVEDDATEEEIEDAAEQAWIDWMNQKINGGWKRIY